MTNKEEKKINKKDYVEEMDSFSFLVLVLSLIFFQ